MPTDRFNSKRSNSRGTALLAVLWLTAALSAIAFSVADTVRAETERGIAAQEGMRAYYLARGGVERTLFAIRNGNDGTSGSPAERFANRRRLYYQEPTGDILIELISEGGKLPMRSLTPDLLYRLLSIFGESSSSAGAIVQTAFSPVPGAIAPGPQNSAAGTAFRPAIASMENVEELMLVPGITSELLYGRYNRLPDGRLVNAGGLADCLSPHVEKSNALDFYSVHPSLLQAMGVPADTAREFAELRRSYFQPLAAYNQWQAGRPLPVGNELGDVFQIRATARVRTPNGTLSETRRTVSLLIQYSTPNPRRFWISPWTHLRWYDQAFSDVATSNAVWAKS